MKDKKLHCNLVEGYFRKNFLKKNGYYNKRLPRLYKICISILDEITHNNREIKKVVDVGCGSGIFTLEVAKQFPQFNEIIGIDFLKEVITSARENTKKYDKVSFAEGNILDIPFKNRTFNVTICINLIHHIHRDDFKKAIEELVRITDKYLVLEIRNKNNIFDFWYTYVMIPFFYKDLPVNTNSTSEVNDITKKHGLKLIKTKGVFPIDMVCRRLLLIYERVDINEKETP